MTNININIPDDLHKSLRIEAAIEEKPIKELVIEILKESVKGDAV